MFDNAIGILFMAIGSVIVVGSVWLPIQALKSHEWMTTNGEIIASQLVRTTGVDGGSMHSSRVSYRYTIDGQEYFGRRVRFGDQLELSWSAPARRIATKYPVGSSVLVHFDSEAPAESVLDPGISVYIFGWLALGGLFAALGFTFLFR